MHTFSPGQQIPSAQFNENFDSLWWEEIGRTTLGSAGDTITVSSLPARQYLKIIASYTGTGGTVGTHIRFNSDSGSNYAYSFAALGGAATNATSQTSLIITGAATINISYVVYDLINISDKEKVGYYFRTDGSTAGAANLPTLSTFIAKWANTSVQINRIDLLNLTGSGDFAIGSEVIVLGHD